MTVALTQLHSVIDVPDSFRAKINDSALYVSFLLLVDCQAPYEFTVNEMAATSVYMAIKLIEKKNSDHHHQGSNGNDHH